MADAKFPKDDDKLNQKEFDKVFDKVLDHFNKKNSEIEDAILQFLEE